ncbi:MATE family efflux transporter [Spirochaeta dissipatitropha]
MENQKAQAAAARNEKLGSLPIGPLLMKLSIPAMVGMFVNALYNLVDTIFVGHAVGAAGIGGLAIAFPFQIFLFAIATMIGVGSASVVSRALGAGDDEKASRASGNALAVGAVTGILVLVSAWFGLDHILVAFGATESLLPYARDYLQIVLLGSPFLIVVVTANNLIRSEGHAKSAMLSMLIGAGANLILDPIFIFGFGMGVRGAALATVLGFILSFLFVLVYYISGRSSVHLHLRSYMPERALIREILVLGFPNFVKQVGGSILAVVLNNVLRVYGGDIAISVFGIINRVMMFSIMPMFGIVQGFQPVAGFNYGAGNYARVDEAVKKASLATIGFTLIASLFMLLFPQWIMRAFGNDPEMIAMGASALRIVVLVLPIIGLQLVGAALFMAIGKALPAFFLSISRQILFLIPLVLIFPMFWGLSGIWFAFPVADILASSITVLCVRHELGKMKQLGVQPLQA